MRGHGLVLLLAACAVSAACASQARPIKPVLDREDTGLVEFATAGSLTRGEGGRLVAGPPLTDLRRARDSTRVRPVSRRGPDARMRGGRRGRARVGDGAARGGIRHVRRRQLRRTRVARGVRRRGRAASHAADPRRVRGAPDPVHAPGDRCAAHRADGILPRRHRHDPVRDRVGARYVRRARAAGLPRVHRVLSVLQLDHARDGAPLRAAPDPHRRASTTGLPRRRARTWWPGCAPPDTTR